MPHRTALDPHSKKILGFVGGGALLVIGLGLYLGARGGAPEPTPDHRGDPTRPEVIGSVPTLAHDSPFGQADSEVSDRPDPIARLPAARPLEPVESLTDAAPADDPAPPPPRLELDDAQLAANAAHDALAAAARTEVESTLRGAHDQLKRACWRPTAAAATFSYNMSFGADGKLLALGISDTGSEGAGPVGACLRAQALDLDIAAPGRRLAVDIDLAFP